jgi:hypothetical protein
MIFKRKAKSRLPNASEIHNLIGKFGLERRQNDRLTYPSRATCGLPAVAFAGAGLRVGNISVGGCSLFDPDEVLGAHVGNEVTLCLTWQDKSRENVQARIVSRVDHRRHIQFLNLSQERSGELVQRMRFGLRAHRLVRSDGQEPSSPFLLANELWISLDADGLVIEDGIHRSAVATIDGKEYSFFKNAWPIDSTYRPVSPTRMEELILYFANIPLATDSVKNVQNLLEDLYLGGQST